MRKTFLMAAMMVAAMTASAQARFQSQTFTLQPRLGGTGAMLTNTPSQMVVGGAKVDADAAAGSMFGVELEYYFNERVSFAGGINLMQAGTGWKDYEYTDMGVKTKMTDLKIETAYLTVPVVANWYVARGLALKTGVQFGFLTKGESKGTANVTSGGTTVKTEVSQDCKDDLKKFDLSIPVGLSYEFKVPFVIDMRYNIGLTKVNKQSAPGEKDSRNSVLTLTLGYKFKL